MSKILIVEDEETISKMYEKILDNADYAVYTAANGKAGLELALDKKPDLILLDIKMPVMSGFDMLKVLRKDEWGKGVPVIVLTSFEADEKITRDVIETEPTYYLIKGENRPSVVLEKVKEVLGEENGKNITS